MDDLKFQMKDHFLRYASYVILDRAIPHIDDGLKPVQRRIVWTLYRMMANERKLHKVANVVGQTMQYHPHGDAPIYEALVNLANKNYLLDKQGNFGNIFTGDPSAASRYIETRLSPLALETLFNPDLTLTVPTYDGRNHEPVVFPAKIPVLLMQGVEGIAVGMATSIMPHNFKELLEAQIAILEERDYLILPDFQTGGIMDASGYDKGKGKVKLRAKVEIKDAKTLQITEICYGTNTENLIRSIDEAAKRGKIKIEGISDYTADKVEVEIRLPRGQYAQELIDALYAYTDCEISISSQIIVIKDNMPWETDVHEILEYNTAKLLKYHQQELENERDRIIEKMFYKSLEQIFIEHRLYKKIETVKTLEGIHTAIAESLEPFHPDLFRVPNADDREKLLQMPIRKISRFDIDKNQEEIRSLEEQLAEVEKHLKSVKKYTINYIKKLIQTYGKFSPRRTLIQELAEIDKRAIATKQIKVAYDPQGGFIGTKVTGDTQFECTNFDKILILFKNGTYTVMNIPEKQYIHQDGQKIIWAGIADKKTVMNVVYKNTETNQCYAKRFVVDKFIMDKTYSFLEDKAELMFLSTDPDSVVELQFIPKASQKVTKILVPLNKVLVKGVSARGNRMANQQVKKVVPVVKKS